MRRDCVMSESLVERDGGPEGGGWMRSSTLRATRVLSLRVGGYTGPPGCGSVDIVMVSPVDLFAVSGGLSVAALVCRCASAPCETKSSGAEASRTGSTGIDEERFAAKSKLMPSSVTSGCFSTSLVTPPLGETGEGASPLTDFRTRRLKSATGPLSPRNGRMDSRSDSLLAETCLSLGATASLVAWDRPESQLAAEVFVDDRLGKAEDRDEEGVIPCETGRMSVWTLSGLDTDGSPEGRGGRGGGKSSTARPSWRSGVDREKISLKERLRRRCGTCAIPSPRVLSCCAVDVVLSQGIALAACCRWTCPSLSLFTMPGRSRTLRDGLRCQGALLSDAEFDAAAPFSGLDCDLLCLAYP